LYQVRPPLPFILGSEFAGVVRESNGQNFKPGDAVCGFVWNGAFAETVFVPEPQLIAVPTGLSMAEAAAYSMTYGTAYGGLVSRGRVQQGETVVVTAGAGGVGTAAIQIAKALGARVIAVVGSDEKCQVAKTCGAEHAINYRESPEWHKEVKELTDGRGANVVLEQVGGTSVKNALKCIAWDGRIVIVGFTSGDIPTIPANLVLLKNCAVTGLAWGEHWRHDYPTVIAAYKHLESLANSGDIKPLVSSTVPLSGVGAALHQLAKGTTVGKLLLDVATPPS